MKEPIEAKWAARQTQKKAEKKFSCLVHQAGAVLASLKIKSHSEALVLKHLFIS